ncbi:hypothetical protein [Rhizocola hellebori]|uniref:hypothetical protein n=1 Tax=Rhizocola hellebori TaxID=1392758 RepID=UPI0019427EAF|nr:hypothetical protein [Rhizocola hellebori]
MDGGLHVYGLCVDCNNLGSLYDGAYSNMANGLHGLWAQTLGLRLPAQLTLPAITVKPGGVVRSILIGFAGLAPHIRTQHPELAAALHHRDLSAVLPEGLRLCLALARGLTARITSGIGGTFLFGPPLDGKPPGIMSLAQAYFPPMAWHLAPTDRSLLDLQGWADVSSWLAYDPDIEVPRPTLVRSLPPVVHPLHDPYQADDWLELVSFDATEIVEAIRLPRNLLS